MGPKWLGEWAGWEGVVEKRRRGVKGENVRAQRGGRRVGGRGGWCGGGMYFE